jgi:hypothetical protein
VVVPAGLQLAVLAGGVRMPLVQVAEVAPVEEQPISRAGSPAGVSAFLPNAIPAEPTVPVYPRKQARH